MDYEKELRETINLVRKYEREKCIEALLNDCEGKPAITRLGNIHAIDVIKEMRND